MDQIDKIDFSSFFSVNLWFSREMNHVNLVFSRKISKVWQKNCSTQKSNISFLKQFVNWWSSLTTCT